LSFNVSNFGRVFLHPVFISLVIAAGIILLLPDYFDKYKLCLEERSFVEKDDGRVCFEDLDNDGTSERIEYFHNELGNAAYKISNQDILVLFQENFTDIFSPFYKRDCFCDYDNNGSKELIVFINSKKGIYLNSIDYSTNKFILKNKHVAPIYKIHGKTDSRIIFYGAVDLDNDNFKELIFSIKAGFTLEPRKIYAYNIVKDSLLYSPDVGCLITVQQIKDIDNDGYNDILTHSAAPGNYPENTDFPYPDNSAWLMVLDHELQFKFEPVEFPGFGSTVNSFFSKDSILNIVYTNQIKGEDIIQFFSYTSEGKLIGKQDFLQEQKHYSVAIIDDFLLLKYANKYLKYDKNFNLLAEAEFSCLNCWKLCFFDLNRDGSEEFIFISKDGQLIISQDDFSHPQYYQLPDENDKVNYSICLNVGENPLLSIQQGKDIYFFSFSNNPLYYLRYAIYAAVFMGVLLFVLLINHLQSVRIKRKHAQEEKLAELQLKSLKNQFNPHFTFNVINTISSMLYEKDKQTIDSYLKKFSRLIRYSLQSSERISNTLNEEITFIKNYLEIQQARFAGVFDYKINIATDVDRNSEVPKMVMHTYVENAIKHGLQPLERGGHLNISVFVEAAYLIIEIDDNGIGRAKSKEMHAIGTGSGLRIMEQIFSMYSELKNKKVRHSIMDKYDDSHNASGTRVRIEIQLRSKIR